MKKLLKHSYTLLVILTCLILVPTTLILESCTGKDLFGNPISDTDSTTGEEPTTTTTTTTEVATTTTTVSTESAVPSSTTSRVPTSTASQPTASTSTVSGAVTPLVIPDKNEVIEFPDTLFIGDSRTVGLRDWVKIGGATFFCAEGISSTNIATKAIKVPGMSDSITLPNVLTQKQFTTVYIMLGINEIGGSLSGIAQKYQKVIDLIHEKQPNAIVVVQSTLRVTKARHDKEIAKNGYFNNNRINELNTHLQGLANGTTVRWLDMNPMFDDGTGHLAAEAAAGDGIHFKTKYYLIWRKYLDTHRVS